jgi:arylsulfatase A-like enzyme
LDALGCYGNPIVKNPAIDAIAAAGCRFDKAYVCQPLCVPQRCSMITGLHPSVHGSMINGVVLPEHFPVYPEIFQSAGYETFAAGKLHFGPISRFPEGKAYKDPESYSARELLEPGEISRGLPYYGFEQVQAVEGFYSPYTQFIARNHPEWLDAANHLGPFEADGAFQTCTSPIPEEHHRTTWTADRTIDFLKNRDKDRPFMAHCSFYDPHHPFDPPESFSRMYHPDDMPDPLLALEALPDYVQAFCDQDNGEYGKSFSRHDREDWKVMAAHYYGMISLIDKNIGRVMEALQECGELENTVVVFVADHGELLGDHGIGTKGEFHYQSLVKVPFIISYPPMIEAGNVNDGLVMTYDLMPTILDLCRLPRQRCTAQSLLPMLQDRAPGRDAVLIEGPGVRTVVDERYRLSVHMDRDLTELYDLKEDPGEHYNISASAPEIKSRMMEKLVHAMAAARRPLAEPIGRW